MTEVIRINEHTWRIENDGVRMFVLEGTKEALMVDTGMTCPEAREVAESLTKLPLKLLNTHTDRDHISGNAAFAEMYMGRNEIPDYQGPGTPIPVDEGDIIDLGERPLKVIDLPGHTNGSVALLDVNNRVLIGGDSIQTGRIFMFGKTRHMDLYIESLTALWENYRDQFDVVYPSHSDFPTDPAVIPGLIEGAKKIASGELTGPVTDFHGTKIRVIDVGVAGFLYSE